MLIAIMQENNLTPDDIDHVHVMTHPLEVFKLWQENTMRTEDDCAFNVPYLLACAAYGDGGPWYIPTAEAYSQGGYSVNVAWCGPQVDNLLTGGIKTLLAEAR